MYLSIIRLEMTMDARVFRDNRMEWDGVQSVE